MKRIRFSALLLLLCLLIACTGCQTAETEIKDGDTMKASYTQIDQETAKKMMEADDGHVIVDVRRQDEYDAGHIPGAILIPNESIGTEMPQALPDLSQIILIYCRSGNRSKQAAQKLADMGYTNIYEFGGINTWTGDVVTDPVPAVLTFSSFDGGGPSYGIVLSDDIVSCVETKAYRDPKKEASGGAGYTVTFTFTGRRPGQTAMTVEQRSPIADDLDHLYTVTVDEGLNVQIELVYTRALNVSEPVPVLVIRANDYILYANLEDNPSAAELMEKLSEQPIEIGMQDYGGFEKVGPLPWTLTRSDEQITTEPGDVILYQGDKITIYYGVNTWSFTRLARINGLDPEELLQIFGEGDVNVSFSVEWGE